MNSQSDWVVVGCFGRPHGIKSLITVHSYTEPRDNILQYANWHIFLNKQWQPIRLLQVEVHDKAIRAQVEGYKSREAVAVLTNCDIAIEKAQLAVLVPGEYYWHELIGLSVFNLQNEALGTVVEIMPTGANDVLVVKGQGEKRHLVPYILQQYVLEIDQQKKHILVDWDADF